MRPPVLLRRDAAGLLFDFHEPLVGLLSFDLPAGAPGTLEASYGEVVGEVASGEKPSTHWYTGQRDAWELPAGPVKPRSRGRRAFRYLRLSGTERFPENFRLHGDDAHPVIERDAFRGNDPLLRAIWDISTRTTRLCMRRYYEDGVKRDGLLWVGDCRVQYLCNLGPFGDHELMRRSLRMIAAS